MKFNLINSSLIIFVFCFFQCCSIQHRDSGFGSGSWNPPNSEKAFSKNKSEIHLEELNSCDSSSHAEFQNGCDLTKLENKKGALLIPKLKNTRFKSPVKWESSKNMIFNNKKKIENALNTLIPKKNSPLLKWILFGLYSLCILLGLIFVLYSFKSTLDSSESDIFQAAGIVLFLVSFLYKIGLKIFDTLPQRGIIYKIGMWATLFGWFTFYPLAVSIPLWIIGDIFDI